MIIWTFIQKPVKNRQRKEFEVVLNEQKIRVEEIMKDEEVN